MTLTVTPPPQSQDESRAALIALWAFVEGLGFSPTTIVGAYTEAEPYALGVAIGEVRYALTHTIAPLAASLLGHQRDQRGPLR
jgi:hypothetical protein